MADYGVKIQLKVDADQANLRKQIQDAVNGATKGSPIVLGNVQFDSGKISTELQKAINKATSDNTVTVKVSGFKLLKSGITELERQIKNSNLVIPVKSIDATQAVIKFRNQLKTMLSGLEIGGLKDFLGDEGRSEVLAGATSAAKEQAAALGEASRKASEYAANLRQLKDLASSLSSTNKQILKLADPADVQELTKEYMVLNDQIKAAQDSGGNISDNDMMALTESIAKLNQKVVAIKEAANARKAEAAEAERAERAGAAASEKAAAAAEKAAAAQEKVAKLGGVVDQRAVELGNRQVSLYNQIYNWIQKNTKAYAEYRGQIDAIMGVLKGSPLDNTQLDALNTTFKNITVSAKEAGLEGNTFFDTFKRGIEKFGGWTIVTRSLMAVINTIKKMIAAVKELDTAMTELKRVTDETELGYDRFVSQAAATAKRIGATMADTVNATADFARLGYSIGDAAQLAEAALVYKNIGDGIEDVSQATESIISTMRAFGIEASGAMGIVDEFNNIGNKFAITSAGIGEALTRSAAALSAAGNTLEQSIGMVTAMNSVVQNPQSVGTALKTLTMYLRAAKTEAEEAGIETDGMANSVSKLRDEINRLTGVDIMFDDKNFKSTFQIIEEISAVWESLEDVTRANVLNLMGGKRNANVLSALITNFDEAKAAATEAMNSMGSAAEENATYLDSIAGKIAVLKASFEELSNAVINSSLVKGLIDIGISATNVATGLQSIGMFLPIVTGLGTAAWAAAGHFGSLVKLAGSIPKLGGYIAVIVGAIELLIYATQAHNRQVRESIDNAKEIVNTYNSQTETYNNNIKTLESLKDRFRELSDGVGENGENVSLTADEYNEYLSIVDRIVQISPSVAGSYASERDAMGEYKDMISAAIEEQDKFIKNEKRIKLGSAEELFEGQWNAYYKAISDARGKKEKYDIVDSVSQALEGVGYKIFNVISSERNGVKLLGDTSFWNSFIEAWADGSKVDFEKYLYGQVYDIMSVFNDDTFLMEIVDDSSRFIQVFSSTLMRILSELSESGVIDGEYITRIMSDAVANLSLAMNGLVGPISNAKSAILVMVDEIMLELEDVNNTGLYDWYNNLFGNIDLPDDTITAFFRSFVADLLETGMSFADAMELIREQGPTLADAIGQDSAFAQLAEQAKKLDGSDESIKAYNDAVREFINGFSEGGEEAASIALILGTYLYGLTGGMRSVSDESGKSEKSINELADSLERLQKGYKILDTASKEMSESGGISIDTFDSIQKMLDDGEKITDYIYAENGMLKLNEDAWRQRSESMMNNDISFLEEEIASMEEYIELARRGVESGREFTDEAIDAFSLRQGIAQHAGSIFNSRTDKIVLPVAEIDFTAGELEWLKNNDYKAYVDNYDDAVSRLKILYAALREITKKDPLDNTSTIKSLKETTENYKSLSDVIKTTSSGVKLSYGDIFEIIQKFPDQPDLMKLFDADSAEEQVSILESVAERYKAAWDTIIDEQINALNAEMDSPDISDERIEQITDYILQLESLKRENVVDGIFDFGDTDSSKPIDLSDAISQMEKYRSLISDVKSELDTSGKNSFESLTSLISLVGDKWGEYITLLEDGFKIDFGDGSPLDEWINNMVDSVDLSSLGDDAEKIEEFREQLRESLIVAADQAAANELLAESYSKVKSAIEGIPGTNDVKQVTFDEYQNLKEVDPRYAAAIEYQNGVLTLNRNAYNEVTNAIIEEKRAMAEAGLQAKLMDAEYIDLTSRIGSLREPEQARLDDLNAEIMGYRVLINELDNASSAYQRFLRASDDTTAERFSAAEKAMKVIEDTLYNADSDIYGKIGREQYQAAVEFLIDPEIEFGTIEWDEALKNIHRYMDGGAEGIDNFVHDLIDKGFANSDGYLNASLDDIAKGLGITVDYLRSVIDEYNEYHSDENKIKVQAEIDTSGAEVDDKTLTEQLASLQEEVASFNEVIDAEHTISLNTEDANQKIDDLETNVGDLDSAITGDHALDIGVQSAVTNIGKVSDGLSDLIIKLAKLSSTVVTTRVHTVYTSSGDKNGRPSGASGFDSAPGGRTLVGELGMETVVDPNTSSWYTVGRTGAEFVNLPKNAIVFNANQTKRLFDAGRIPSRGKSMAPGNVVGTSGFRMLAEPDDLSKSVDNLGKEVNNLTKAVAGNTSGNIAETGFGSNTSSSKKNSGGGSASSKEEESKVLEELIEKYKAINDELEHLIDHEEHLYKVSEHNSDFAGMKGSLTEQARIYQDIMKNASDAVNELIAAGASGADAEVHEMEKIYWSAYDNFHSLLDQIGTVYIDAINDKIDKISTAYDRLSGALQEFRSDGRLSVGTFQQLVSGGIQYLGFLKNINGQYVLNGAALNEMLLREKEQLAVEEALAYVERIKMALQYEGADVVNQLIDLSDDYSDTTWDVVYANTALLQSLGLTDEQYAKIIQNLEALQELSSDTFDRFVGANVLQDQIDGVQSAFEVLTSAVEEFNDSGYVSIDTFQKLASQGLQYMSLLEMTNGQYVINEQAVNNLIAAEKEQLAIETSLEYLRQLAIALETQDAQAVANLVNMTNAFTSATWDAVDAQLALVRALGLTDEEFNIVESNIDKFKDIATNVDTNITKAASSSISSVSSASGSAKSAYEQQLEALDKILDYTKDLVKYETEQRIDAIKAEIDEYKKLINLRKEALRASKDEASYAEKLADKAKEIAKIQAQIDKLSLDNSREARAERAALSEKLAELQNDMRKTQDDHAYDAQMDALDDQAKAYEESRQEEISILQDSISSEEKLYQEALKRLDSGWETLYNDLISWNIEAGRSLNSEITENWNLAANAVKRYGSYVKAVVERTGNPMTSYGDTSSVPHFHSGGVVGIATVKDDEVAAILQKGEAVITEPQRNGLYKIIDFAKELSDRLGSTIGKISLPQYAPGLSYAGIGGMADGRVATNETFNFSPTISVNVDGSSVQSASHANDIGKKIADATLGELKDAFTKRGVQGIFNSGLKQK